jgi:hypothetical protein
VLIPVLPAAQLRRFIPGWLEAWGRGDPGAEEALHTVDQELLLPFLAARARMGDVTVARLLRPVPSLALRSLVGLVAATAPAEVAHLALRQPEDEVTDDRRDPADPIAGRDLAGLVSLIDETGVARGLAVRAVHALTAHEERAVEPLAVLTTDPRPEVRSAALRALRMVASRERTLAATVEVLRMETRRDVVLSLMASLAHGRHSPALPSLLERVADRDLRIRRGAHAALLAWGPEVLPALRHAARHTRPDRRPLYASLISELE